MTEPLIIAENVHKEYLTGAGPLRVLRAVNLVAALVKARKSGQRFLPTRQPRQNKTCRRPVFC